MAVLVERDLPIDKQHLLHRAIKLRIPTLEVVPNLVGLDCVLVQNSPDGALAGLGESGVPHFESMLADMGRQCRDGPLEFDVLCFGVADLSYICLSSALVHQGRKIWHAQVRANSAVVVERLNRHSKRIKHLRSRYVEVECP